ncbi:LruC domain-containing protein [Roseateles oligotrophus]|uniref:LruC domain-containing protein n=1 Tax=Roseateles oligotrophus TaxID=1769250 RepID=A0ABT2Y8S6_9BURK|nr:LruC domain-containing protein [Roseateles oligotrophus]MCV2366696.1 LruC domain-containing protein [Roseateles oligotrophus]
MKTPFIPATFWNSLGRRLFCLLCLLWGGLAAAQVSSVRLSDVIAANGRGSINLLRASGNAAITVAQLEQLRLDHRDYSTGSQRNFLSLGVDINENNKGLENSSAQGVTLAKVSLTVTWPNETRVYTDYRSATQALLAKAGSQQRSQYYTLLGEGGSSRITGSNDVQQHFDSTLDIFVPDSLLGASSAVLSIELLAVNKALNEPENFYDFSGGFEDLALLNRTDSLFLNTTLVESSDFRASAPAVETVEGIVSNDSASVTSPSAWSYYPSASDWYYVAYEDNYPDRGDYDFNDAVVAFRYKLGLDFSGLVMRIEAEAYLLADGAQYQLDWNFRLPVPGSGVINCQRKLPGAAGSAPCSASLSGGMLQAQAFGSIDNSGTAFGIVSGWNVNTQCGIAPKQAPHMRLSVQLEQALDPASIGAATPYLLVQHSGRVIDPLLRDANGYPYALMLPPNWRHACEETDLGLAYPRLRNYLSSGGQTDLDWFLYPDSGKVFDLGAWAWDG